MSWLARLLDRTPPPGQRMVEALTASQAGDYGVALAHEGNARAQSNMGAAFLQGRGVEQDRARPILRLGRAAEQGDAGGRRSGPKRSRAEEPLR